MSGSRTAPTSRATERALWVAIYLVLVLAPLAFLAAAPAGENSDDVFVAVAIGFVAITVMALQVVISSRAAAFTAPFGFSRLIRFHRLAGLAAVVLIVAHVVTVVADEDDRLSWLHPLDAPLAGRLGQAAVLLLVLLTISALWRRALRIPYEVWRGLHVALSLGAIALAFGHIIAVSRFSQTGTIRWLTLGFVVAALLGAFYLRVARQFLAARRPYRLTRSVREPDGSVTLEFAAVGHPGAVFVPGQFAWLKPASSPYALTEHPFSYASSAHAPDRPSFTIKPIGDFTAALETLAEGDSMLIDGPHGAPALVDGRDHVLIAGGSGITPAISALRTAAEEDDPRRLRLLYFVRDGETAALRDQLEALEKQERTEVTVIPSRPSEDWQGPSGRLDTSLLGSLLPEDRGDWSYFVCGPPGMVDTAEAALRKLGISSTQVQVERYQLA